MNGYHCISANDVPGSAIVAGNPSRLLRLIPSKSRVA
jgi:hypothetical protein